MVAALRGVGGVCCAVVAAGVLALPHYSTDLWPALVLLFIGLGILGMPIVDRLPGLPGGGTGASRQSRRSPHLLESAVQGLPQAVIVLNDEKVVLWNAAAERLFGWTARETVGRTLPFALGGGAAPDAPEAPGRPRTKAGAWIDVPAVSSFLRDPQGRVTGRMLVFTGSADPARPEDRDPSLASLLEVPRPIMVTASSATDISTVLEIRNRLQIQSQVASVSRALSRLAPSAEVMKIIGEGALWLGKADRAAVYLRQPDGAITCPWSRGLSESYVAQVMRYAKAIADGRIMDWTKPDLLEISGRGIDGSAPVLYNDVAALPHGAAVPKLTQVEGYRALANWPLTREGEILGLVSCYHNAPRKWTEIERESFGAFCQAAADAIDNGRRYDEQAQRAADLEVFTEISKRLRVAQNPEAIYPILVGQAMNLIRADKGVLFLLEPKGAGLRCVYMAGLPPEARSDEAFPTSGSAFGKVAETGTPYRTDNLGGEPLPVWLNAYRSIGPAAIVPVRSETEITGALALGRERGPAARPFADPEIRLLEGIADIGGTAVRRAKLFQNLENSYLQMVLSLARTMDARDHYTSGHSERIAVWAEEVARALGCDEAAVQEIRWGALLHDIGKIGVPDEILRKPSHLTEEEWAVMRQHPIIGEEILASTERMRGVAKIVRHHQEKWNGTGYPDKLRGQEIPLGARILAVVDTYSAITDDRPYKKARSHEAAIAELRRCAGTQFDPEVVDAFRRVVHRARAQPGRAQ